MESHYIWLWLALSIDPGKCSQCPASPGCFRVQGRDHVTCSQTLDAETNSNTEAISAVTICAFREPSFNLSDVVRVFPNAHTVALVNNDVSSVTASGTVPNAALRVLDLRNNSLSYLDPQLLMQIPELQEVYLSGNPWKCNSALMWLFDEVHNSSSAYTIVDWVDMLCSEVLYEAKPVVPVMGFFKSLQEECPKEPPNNCSCNISHVARNNTNLLPTIEVDCRNLGLLELPPVLPTNTTILHVEGNLITDLQPLISNAHYRGLKDIYLDYNHIKSIAILEGADWLLKFRLLSLKGNLLTHLPTYALDNALERNHDAVDMYLGLNPWQCNCQFIPSFQEFLVKYIKLVKDVSDVKCSFVKGGENSLVRVRDISRNAVCREAGSYSLQPLDLLNGVLASLILFLLGKLAYDYWTFKRTGKLPWIVTKMP